MKHKLLFLTIIAVCAIALKLNAQAPVISWQTTLGGNDTDSLTDIKPTSDGGFIACGTSKSNISGSKAQNAYNNSNDYWVVKLRANGAVKWSKTIGGNGEDLNPVIIETPDGGYMVAGRSKSDSSGNKSENALNESYDYWVIKLNKKGNVQWDNTLGNIQLEAARGIAATNDNGFIIAGYAHSNNGYDKTDLNRGSSLWGDYWLVKLNRRGATVWDKTYGGGNDDKLTCIKPTNDGGFIMGGYSYSPAEFEKTDSFIGLCDYWIVKIDADGNRQWDKIYGGLLSDYQTCVAQTADGGYILGGYSNSPAGFNKSVDVKGVTDYWVVKTDKNGNQQWDKTFGGSLGDYMYSVQQTSDKGYLLAGTSNSNADGDKSEASKGGKDVWVVKIDSLGNKLWDKTYGGSGTDVAAGFYEYSAGNYIMGAASTSGASGDKSAGTVGGTGKNDFWIASLRGGTSKPAAQATILNNISAIKANSETITKKLSLFITPNPVKDAAIVRYGSTDNKTVYLSVYDASGKIYKQVKLDGGTGKSYTLNMAGLAPGAYYVVIKSGNSLATQNIVKE